MGETREQLTRPLLRARLTEESTGLVVVAWQPWFELVDRVIRGLEGGLADTEDVLLARLPTERGRGPDGESLLFPPVGPRERRAREDADRVAVPVQRLIDDAARSFDHLLPPLLTPLAVRRFDRHIKPRAIPRTFTQVRGTTTATTIYSPAPGLLGTVAQLIVANTTASAETYRLFIDIDGTTYDEDSSLFWDISLAGNASDYLELFLPMNDAASLGVQVSANNALTFTLGGLEIPKTFIFTQAPLGQVRPSVINTPVSLVTTPINVRTLISGLLVSNVAAGGKSAIYSVYFDEDGATYDDTTALSRSVSLSPGQTDILSPLTLTLTNTAGNLAVETNDGASELNFTAFGFAEAA